MGHKKWGCGYQYLVKWENYPISENTWQSVEDLKGAQEILLVVMFRGNPWVQGGLPLPLPLKTPTLDQG